MRQASFSLLVALSLSACLTPQPEAPVASPAPAPAAPTSQTTSGVKTCAWPNGAEAAVSLTYDDSLASQVNYAVPALDRAGIKATFFLSGTNLALFGPLAKNGHELASHTVHHPCNADLAALSLDDMASELDAGNAAVQALGVSGKLTFAYPCGQTLVKDQASYVPLVQARFRAARGVAGVVADPASVDLFNVPALFPPSSSDGSDVLAFIERARQSHGWAVIGVHGVSEAGEYLQLPQAAHDKIISYLAEHARTIWTAPFGSVADVVIACRH
jgi:peptidoglycan/xylan/chitin deacetylase (PgdA/CDA1 family)